jgi:hypothetical protein
MSQGAWDTAANTLALLANVNRDPDKTAAYTPDDFNPYIESGEKIDPNVIKVTPDTMAEFKDAFTR